MRTLFLECQMGAAGDMIAAALLELQDDPVASLQKLNSLGLESVRYAANPRLSHGIYGTRFDVLIDGESETVEDIHAGMHAHAGHRHEHCHHHHGEGDAHEHCHHHHGEGDAHVHCHHHHIHRGLREIEAIVDSLAISDRGKHDVMGIYHIIAQAESRAHRVPVKEIHFHEVGAMDAIADITAVCVLLADLKVDRVITSPINVGSGWVRCAHGVLPVPAPATAYILEGVPFYRSTVPGELCTPTGAAILKYFTAEFDPASPALHHKVGYGLGTKTFDRLNCIRAYLGESCAQKSLKPSDTATGAGGRIVKLECNLDDMTPEYIGYAMEQLFKAGARDVWTQSIGMKKNRPATMLCCLCTPQRRDDMIRAIFAHTTTIGVREEVIIRHELDRKNVVRDTPHGEIRIKHASGYGVEREKPEFEDIARIADECGLPAIQIMRSL